MKAVLLEKAGGPPVLRDVPAPTPGAHEVLVRVRASSVNPVDNAIAAGMLAEIAEHVYPITLGRDYAGVIEEVGADVAEFSVGDEVFGFVPGWSPAVHDGSWAELIVVPESASIARRPEGLEVYNAGAAPLAAVTAMAAIDALDPVEGDVLLVVGATGGVGGFAVQLAIAAGATVIAPALSDDEEYLRELGVSEIVPREGDVAATVRERHPDGVDAVLDLVSYAPGAFDAALKAGGRVASPNNAAGEGPGRSNVMGMPSGENVRRAARLLDAGTLAVHIHDTYALDRVGEALQAPSTGHVRGKLALQVA